VPDVERLKDFFLLEGLLHYEDMKRIVETASAIFRAEPTLLYLNAPITSTSSSSSPSSCSFSPLCLLVGVVVLACRERHTDRCSNRSSPPMLAATLDRRWWMVMVGNHRNGNGAHGDATGLQSVATCTASTMISTS